MYVTQLNSVTKIHIWSHGVVVYVAKSYSQVQQLLLQPCHLQLHNLIHHLPNKHLYSYSYINKTPN